MPLPVIIAAVGVVLLAVVGISLFSWRVYARAAVGPVSGQVGVEGPNAGGGGGSGGGSGGGAAGGDALPWLAILGVGGLLLFWRGR